MKPSVSAWIASCFDCFDELPLPGEHLLDDLDQLGFAQQIQFQVQPDPFAKVVECARHGQLGDRDGHFLGHVLQLRVQSRSLSTLVPGFQAQPLTPDANSELHEQPGYESDSPRHNGGAGEHQRDRAPRDAPPRRRRFHRRDVSRFLFPLARLERGVNLLVCRLDEPCRSGCTRALVP